MRSVLRLSFSSSTISQFNVMARETVIQYVFVCEYETFELYLMNLALVNSLIIIDTKKCTF